LKDLRHIIISLARIWSGPALTVIFTAHSFAALPPKYSVFIGQDTVPKKNKPSHSFNRYFNVLTDSQQRDSLLVKLSRQNEAGPVPDSVLWKQRQNKFSPYKGRVIRNIYYNRLKVFGTQIEDTTVSTSMKLIHFANKLHLNTKEWMLRQSLFFGENDTVNAFKMVENERYLRNLPFMQDARLYIINTYQSLDSVDIMVVTKDLFEYGGAVSDLSLTSFAANVYNNNLFGAGQRVLLGLQWNSVYRPQWRTEISYNKYNLGGSFADISFGYSGLNDHGSIDTGVYEHSYFISVNRPLYSSWAKFTGGLSLAYNQSLNIYSFPDTVFRKYEYRIMDVWGGYNFRTQFKNNGIITDKPNLAIELRQYNLAFVNTPKQPIFSKNPNYNDHHFTLSKLVFFRQEFIKTNYFFGFGRTEDIPVGYNASVSAGLEDWVGIRRNYAAVEGQKFWLTRRQDLFNTSFGIGSFWQGGNSEDAVIHVETDYYSRLLSFKNERLREFFRGDYLTSPNPLLYKPVNINRENGILGYRNGSVNGFQRLNLSSQTIYYSHVSVYGFKFNFFTLLQASLLADKHENIFKGPLYSGLGGGLQIKNENLSFNTLQVSAMYLPVTTPGIKTLYFEITTIADLRFSIFALQAPAFLSFR
jgi:hypothetical protein